MKSCAGFKMESCTGFSPEILCLILLFKSYGFNVADQRMKTINQLFLLNMFNFLQLIGLSVFDLLFINLYAGIVSPLRNITERKEPGQWSTRVTIGYGTECITSHISLVV